MKDTRERLTELLGERILVLDGSWGVLIHQRSLTEEEYRGERFATHARDVRGDPDLLNLTQPALVAAIHDDYFAAGADIATTNTFTATRIGQADYALEDAAAEMSLEGARLARAAADAWTERTPDKPRFVAGSVGPLNVSLSVSPKVEDAAYRAATFDQVRDVYAEQIAALREGGVDLLMIETIFDTLNAKAALVAASEVAPELPLWISLHRDRSLRAEPLRADGGGVLDLGRARRPAPRRRQLLARAPPRCGRSSRGSHRSRRRTPRVTRTPACRTSSAFTTSSPATRAGSCARSRRTAS